MKSKTKRGIIGILLIIISVGYYLYSEGIISVTGKTDNNLVITAKNGGELIQNDLAIYFPAGVSTNDFTVSLQQKDKLPDEVIIEGEKVTNLNKYFRTVSPVYNVKTEKADLQGSFFLSMIFDPKILPGLAEKKEQLLFVTISEGQLEVLKLVDGDIMNGFIMAEVKHNSDFAICVWDIGNIPQPVFYHNLWEKVAESVKTTAYTAATSVEPYVKYLRGIKDYFRFIDVALNPSVFIEPDNPDIVFFIKQNDLEEQLEGCKKYLANPRIDETRKKTFSLELSKVIESRSNIFFKRALSISEIVQENKGVCIDLSHLFASVLYKLGYFEMKLIQGTAFGVAHVWPEVIIDGRPYVVDTTYGSMMKFKEINSAYSELKLIPNKMYAKDSSLQKYDFYWYRDALDETNQLQAEIDALEREYEVIEREFESIKQYAFSRIDFTAQEIYDIYMGKLKKIQDKIDKLRIFGTAKSLEGGFKGTIYQIPKNTNSLPDFSRLSSVGSIYTYSLNIAPRYFDEGFPGVSSDYEWFAIKYEGEFVVNTAGNYSFELTSDDGSRLLIDEQVVIDNDGIHSPRNSSGTVGLSKGVHSIRVEYFQGPRYHIALQLFVTPPSQGEREVFDIRKQY